MLEMLTTNWERPIYMAITVGGENRLNMDNHFVQEGLAYRFTPLMHKHWEQLLTVKRCTTT